VRGPDPHPSPTRRLPRGQGHQRRRAALGRANHALIGAIERPTCLRPMRLESPEEAPPLVDRRKRVPDAYEHGCWQRTQFGMRRVPIASDADRVVAGGSPLNFPLCPKRSLTEQGCTPIAPIPGYQGPHRVLSRCSQPRCSRGMTNPPRQMWPWSSSRLWHAMSRICLPWASSSRRAGSCVSRGRAGGPVLAARKATEGPVEHEPDE
jgi:hypothetical protein